MPDSPTLRRSLGPVHAYAALVGMLVGAGIFKVSDATRLTGPGVVLGYVLLAPVILAATVPYAAFQSAPWNHGSGGDYSHIRTVFGPGTLAFLAGWLKLISYLGALVYLALALADYALELGGLPPHWRDLVATGCLVLFWWIHVRGVRWFGNVQVWMCALLGAAVLVLVVPGLFAVEAAHFDPFLTGGAEGLLRSLPVLFFSYAGFEAIAHTAGEVRDSERTLPRVYLRGILLTMLIFTSMSAVAVGVLGHAAMTASPAPMAAAAGRFLPFGAAAVVALGGVMATATSVNATMAVPPRLAITMAEDGFLPRGLARVHAGTGAPAFGLTASLLVALALLWTGQHVFALSIAVLALLSVYLLHTWAFLRLPRRVPALFERVSLDLPRGLQRAAAWVALVALAALIATMVRDDVGKMLESSVLDRLAARQPLATELILGWSLLGWALTLMARREGPA